MVKKQVQQEGVGSFGPLHGFRENAKTSATRMQNRIPFCLLQRSSRSFLWFTGLIKYSFPLLFRSKLADSRWGHSPRESLRNVCNCTQERKYEVNIFFLLHLTLSVFHLGKNCTIEMIDPIYFVLGDIHLTLHL